MTGALRPWSGSTTSASATTPCSTSMTPMRPPSWGDRGAAPCWTRSGRTIIRWWPVLSPRLLVLRRLHRLHEGIQAAAEDPLQHLHLRRPRASPLPGSHLHRVRYPQFARVRPAPGPAPAQLAAPGDGAKRLGLAVLAATTPSSPFLSAMKRIPSRRPVPVRARLLRPVRHLPAVPYHAGVLRVQVNSNHTVEAIDGLVSTFAALQREMALPGPDHVPRHVA